MTRRLILLAILLAFPRLAAAQTIDKWTLRINAVGSTVIISTTDLPAASVVCNLAAPVSTTTTINPLRVVFDDPVTAGRVCIWTDPGTGPLASLPFGPVAYESSITATNVVATTAESIKAPFTRPGVAPGVPTGLRLVR